MSLNGIEGSVKAGQLKYNIKSKMIGEFNQENILSVVSILHSLGLEKEKITQGINKYTCVPGRLEIFELATGAKAIIDYAHTPDAYEKVLGTLRDLLNKKNNLYVVFGAGGERDKKKGQRWHGLLNYFLINALSLLIIQEMRILMILIRILFLDLLNGAIKYSMIAVKQ